jgi:hypothetical protein
VVTPPYKPHFSLGDVGGGGVGGGSSNGQLVQPSFVGMTRCEVPHIMYADSRVPGTNSIM